MKTELTTVPTFIYEQGDKFDVGAEYPIQVKYWNGSVTLEQNGNEVIMSNEHLKPLFREILRHLPGATAKLNR